jgi:hypothetical protein
VKTLRRFHYILFFAGVLAFCSYKVKSQLAQNETRRADTRDSFIHLCASHHFEEAQRLYVKLIELLEKEPTTSLIADQKCAALFAANSAPSNDDLVWRYYTSVNKELEKRQQHLVALNKGRK